MLDPAIGRSCAFLRSRRRSRREHGVILEGRIGAHNGKERADDRHAAATKEEQLAAKKRDFTRPLFHAYPSITICGYRASTPVTAGTRSLGKRVGWSKQKYRPYNNFEAQTLRFGGVLQPVADAGSGAVGTTQRPPLPRRQQSQRNEVSI